MYRLIIYNGILGFNAFIHILWNFLECQLVLNPCTTIIREINLNY